MDTHKYLLRGSACNERFRFFVADTTQIVQTALALHNLYPASALLLGRLLTGALLMGADLKEMGHNLTLNVEADGPLKGAVAIYEHEGKVRGYAKNPQFYDSVVANNCQIGKLLGSGTLNVIKDFKLKTPTTGTIELISGEIGEDIAHYYLRSEQVPTAISLGVLFDRESTIRSAGGFLIQQMPSTSPAETEKLMQNLAETPYITDLLDMGLGWKQILDNMIFKDMEWHISDKIVPQYLCPCSKERFAYALRLLGYEELSAMTEGITTTCHYCNKSYDFSSEDFMEIMESLREKGV